MRLAPTYKRALLVPAKRVFLPPARIMPVQEFCMTKPNTQPGKEKYLPQRYQDTSVGKMLDKSKAISELLLCGIFGLVVIHKRMI
jgi:hypothetical protein